MVLIWASCCIVYFEEAVHSSEGIVPKNCDIHTFQVIQYPEHNNFILCAQQSANG